MNLLHHLYSGGRKFASVLETTITNNQTRCFSCFNRTFFSGLECYGFIALISGKYKLRIFLYFIRK